MQEKGEEEDLKDKDNFFNQGSPQDGKMEVRIFFLDPIK